MLKARRGLIMGAHGLVYNGVEVMMKKSKSSRCPVCNTPLVDHRCLVGKCSVCTATLVDHRCSNNDCECGWGRRDAKGRFVGHLKEQDQKPTKCENHPERDAETICIHPEHIGGETPMCGECANQYIQAEKKRVAEMNRKLEDLGFHNMPGYAEPKPPLPPR